MRLENWHRNLLAITVAQAFSATGFSFVLGFIPLYVQSLGVANPAEAAQWAGAISAATALSMAVAQPIWGGVADRHGRKPMLVRSMIGASIIVSLMGLANSPLQLLVLRFIQGSITGVSAASSALVSTCTPKHRLGFALGISQVAIFVGTSIGPLIGGVIADHYGYHASFFAGGFLLLVGGLVVVGFVRESFVRPPSGQARGSVWSESRALLSLSLFPSMIAVVFLVQLGGVIVSPVLSLFIAELHGPENVATAAGLVLAAAGALSAASAVAIGRVSDRVGHLRILVVCLLGAAASYFPQAFVEALWQLLLLRMLLGVFLGGLMPTASALVAGLVPEERRGAAFGLVGAVNAAANGVGPLLGAAIATHWGMRAVFLATGVLFAMCYGWVGFGVRARQAPEHGRP